MPEKDEDATSKEPTLKDVHEKLSRVENQLLQQDERAKHEILFTNGAFGTSIFLAGISLQVTNTNPVMSTLLMAWGFVIVAWAWFRFQKTKD